MVCAPGCGGVCELHLSLLHLIHFSFLFLPIRHTPHTSCFYIFTLYLSAYLDVYFNTFPSGCCSVQQSSLRTGASRTSLRALLRKGGETPVHEHSFDGSPSPCLYQLIITSSPNAVEPDCLPGCNNQYYHNCFIVLMNNRLWESWQTKSADSPAGLL